MFKTCVSDLGSQLVAGANSMKTFLSDVETLNFLSHNGINSVDFQHFCKGNSALGSLIEVCVKQVKHLMYKSIGKIILDYFEFNFLMMKAKSLINKRPIAFKDGLRSLEEDELPIPVTPEVLIRGYETVPINIIPNLQPNEEEWLPNPSSIQDSYKKLRKVRENLVDLYHSEFLTTLTQQAIDKSRRYEAQPHRQLKVGDIVLLIEKHTKRYQYPMGKIKKIETNSNGEVTAAHILKGVTGETVYRHATSLILLLTAENQVVPINSDYPLVKHKNKEKVILGEKRPVRKSAEKCRKFIRDLSESQK